MPYGELYIPPIPKTRNAVTGQFLKGNVPYNKGKKWSEYMDKRAQKRAAKGWKNLDRYRPNQRPDNAGRCRKAVIAVEDDGTWYMFNYLGAAAEALGGSRENIGRCCRFNANRLKLRNGKVNTDHKYNGYRFYFESDNIWTTKITQQQ